MRNNGLNSKSGICVQNEMAGLSLVLPGSKLEIQIFYKNWQFLVSISKFFRYNTGP